jgi:thioredoxin 1
MDEVEEIRRRRMMDIVEKQKKKEMESVGKPVELTDESLGEVTGRHPLVVVDCWAPWCAPCHMIAPVIEELAHDYAGRILFGKLNVDENHGAVERYKIRGIPALLVFKEGRHVDTLVGAAPRETLEPKLTQHIKG